MRCNVCDGTGFLNTHQLPDEIDITSTDAVLAWIGRTDRDEHDVQVCTCCGDGETWYGEPGEHYGRDDRRGFDGPYAYNGGLCECD